MAICLLSSLAVAHTQHMHARPDIANVLNWEMFSYRCTLSAQWEIIERSHLIINTSISSYCKNVYTYLIQETVSLSEPNTRFRFQMVNLAGTCGNGKSISIRTNDSTVSQRWNYSELMRGYWQPFQLQSRRMEEAYRIRTCCELRTSS